MRRIPTFRPILRFLSFLRPMETLAVVSLLAACLVAAAPAVADDLGFFEQRRVLSDAEDALAAGRYEQAVDLFGQVVEGTDADNARHAQALLGSALAELGHEAGDADAARRHLTAYLANSEAEQKAVAKALQQTLERAAEASKPAPPPAAPEPEPEPEAEEEDGSAKRIASLERQLASARAEIAEKEKVIEQLRKIVVDEGG